MVRGTLNFTIRYRNYSTNVEWISNAVGLPAERPPASPRRALHTNHWHNVLAPSEVPPGVQLLVRALVAFDHIHLTAGEARTVTLHVEPRQLQYWSTKENAWQTATGKRTVSVGPSSRDLRVEQAID
jgi:hypothetical protein